MLTYLGKEKKKKNLNMGKEDWLEMERSKYWQ